MVLVACPKCRNGFKTQCSTPLDALKFIETHMVLTSNKWGLMYKHMDHKVVIELYLCIKSLFTSDFPPEISLAIINSIWMIDLKSMASKIESVPVANALTMGMGNFSITIPDIPAPDNMAKVITGYYLGPYSDSAIICESAMALSGEFMISGIRRNGIIVERYVKVTLPEVDPTNHIMAKFCRKVDGVYIGVPEFKYEPIRVFSCDSESIISFDHIFAHKLSTGYMNYNNFWFHAKSYKDK
jgi:hypothetical protein